MEKSKKPINHKTCADCIYSDVCFKEHLPTDLDPRYYDYSSITNVDECCEDFKDKSRFIELPCEKGDILQYDGVDYEVDHWNILATSFSKDNHLHIFDVKEAEKALKGGVE
jgi:hypothetical protein